MPPFLSFMEAMLGPAQIYMNGVYDMKFFTGVFLNSLLSVGAWMVKDHIVPSHVPPMMFHVYRPVVCLQ
jgi:hypothetical protein